MSRYGPCPGRLGGMDDTTAATNWDLSGERVLAGLRRKYRSHVPHGGIALETVIANHYEGRCACGAVLMISEQELLLNEPIDERH